MSEATSPLSSKPRRKTSRRIAREAVLQAIFWQEYHKGLLTESPSMEDLEQRLFYIIAMREVDADTGDAVRDIPFAKALCEGICKRGKEIEQRINTYTRTFALPKVAPIDRAVLYIGTYELLFSDAPPKVALNEAIDIAKQFGASKSFSFINGILNAIMHEAHGTKKPQ